MSDFNENIEFIESYFRNKLSDAERKNFEERCVQDAVFAREVAVFITTEEGVRQKLLQEKRQSWPGSLGGREGTAAMTSRKVAFLKWLPYASAASLIFAVVIYFLLRHDTPNQLADRYVSENFRFLSQTMNASNDSLQQGIAAYNNEDYPRALQIFENLYQSDQGNIRAKKNMGLVYLVTEDYDKALLQFDDLANKQDVYGNPGLFLKAVTLLKRNNPGDTKTARSLLEQVVSQKAEGSREAEKWLRNW